MKRRLIGKIAGYITYSVTTINKTYGDSKFTNPINIVGDGVITYSSNNTTVATVDLNTGEVTIVKPGVATITASVSDSTYYSYETKNITYILNIAKAQGNVSQPPVSATIPYTGSAQNLVTAGSGTGAMYYKLNNGGWSTNIPTAINHDTYTVYYKAGENDYYTESSVGSLQVTIPQNTPNYVAPTAKTLVYNSEDLELLTAGSTSDGTIYYSIDNSTWSETIPTGKNADTYTVYWKLDGDNNHTNVSSTSIEVTIDKAVNPLTATKHEDWIYDGESHALVSNVSGQGTITYSLNSGTYTQTIPEAINVGTYMVKVNASGNSNYYPKEISFTISVSKVTPTVMAPTAKSLTYTGSNLALINAGSTNFGTLKYSLDNSTYSTTIPVGKSSGTYTVYYRVDGDSNINDVSAKSIEVTIAKADPSYTAPTANNRTYDTTSKVLLNAGSTSDGTILYSSDNTTWSTTIPSLTNTGTYTTYWRIVGDSNHNDKASTSISTTISPKIVNSPTITLSQDNYIYSNTAYKPTPTVKDETTTISSNEYTVSYTDNINAGTATCVITDKTGGNYTVSGSKTFTISKVTPTVTAPTANDLTYTNNNQALVTAGSTNWGTMQYSTTQTGTYSTTIPTGKDAGNYEVWYKVVGDSNINDVAAVKVTITIKKANPTYTAPTAVTGLSYNTSAQTLLNAGTVTGGTILYSSDNSSWSTTIPTGTNAGTYTSYWKIVGDSNHNDVASSSINTTISKINLSVTEVNYNAAYDGNSHSSTVKVTSNGWDGKTIVYGSSTSYGTTATSTGTTGTAYALVTATNYTASTTVYYKITGGTNHNDYTDSVTFAISKKSTNAPILTAGGTTTYTGTTYYATAKNGNDNPAGTIYYGASSGATTYSLTASTTATNMGSMGRADVGTTTIYAFFRPTDTINYSNSASASTTVTISNKATGYLTATTTNRTYNGSAQTIATVATNSGDYYFGLGSSTTSAPSSWGSKNTALSVTTVGTYYVWAKCDTSTNYNAVEAKYMATVTVSLRTVTVTAPTKTDRTYTGSAQTIFAAGSCTTGGTMYYSDTNKTFSTSTWSTSLPYTQKTDYGTYTLYYYCYVSDITNNTGSGINEIKSISATINRGTRSGAVSCNNVIYGSTVTATVSVNPTNWTGGTVTWGITNGTGTATINSSGVVTPTKVGTVTITATVGASGNYAGYTATSKLITISQRTVTPTAPTATNRNYNGSAQTIFSGGSCTAGGTMYYSASDTTFSTSTWSTSLPYTLKTDAGTYTIYWYCYVSDTTNNTGTNINTKKSISATINKVAATLPGTISGDRKDTDHTPARATVSKDYTGGTLQYSTDNGSTWNNVTWSSGNLTANPSTSTIGDISVKFRVNPDGNHTASSISDAITLTVVKSTDASVTVSLSNALTYTGSAQTIATASNAHGISSYYIGYKKDAQATADSQITWNSANTTPLQATNAGDYYVYYKFSVDSSHSGDKAYTYVGKVIINKKARSGAVSCNNVTYGSTVTASVSGNTESGAITWGITAGTGTATISNGVVTPTKVGKVTVTASVAATANYAAYTATSKEITISLRTVTWSAPTRTNRTYNGSDLIIFTAGSCSAGGTMKYSTDNSTWSTSLPYTLKKEPGTYTIYYKCEVSDTTNNTGTNINTSYSLQAVISKISTNAPVLTAGGTTTYTGTTYYATAKNGSGNPAGTIYYGTSAGSTSYSLTASTTAANMTSMGRANVGTTTIYAFFRPTDTSHYYDSAGTTTTVTISNRATGSSGSVSNPAAQTYKASGTYSYQLGISGATGTVTYPTSITVKNSSNTTISGWSCTSAGVVTVPAATTAGSYTVTGNVTIALSTNYNAVSATSKTWTITINKASQAAPTATGATVTYHNTATASASGGGGFGSIMWTNGNSRTAVGEQTTAAYWSGDANHNASPNSSSVTLKVNKATDQSVTVTLTNRNYNTSALVIASATSHGCTYYLAFGSNGTTAPTSGWTNGSLSSTNTGTYYIWYKGTADGNHSADISATYKGTVVINKIDPTYVAPTKKNNLSYTGSAQTLYNAGSNTTAGSFSYTNGSKTDAGTYTVSWSFTPTDTTNYNTKSGSFDVTIARAKSASASASNKTYNGTTESNGTAQTGVTGSNVSWSGTTSATNAGSYTAYATPTSNYAWSDGTYALKTISWSIARRGQTAPVLNGASAVFHNTATATVKTAGTVSGSTAAAPGTLTWSNQSRTAVGSQTATAYYAATATNFSASPVSNGVTVQITQASDASVSVTLKSGLTYSRGAQTLATATSHGCTYYLALGSNGTSAPSSGWTNNSLTATNAGTYYIWYKGTKDGNHSNDINATYKGTVVINKATPVIATNPSNTSPTYNGSALNLLSGGSYKHSSSDSTAVAGTFSYLKGTNAGNYSNPTWTFTPTDTTNYNNASGTRTNTTTTIAKAPLSNVTIAFNTSSFSYNGNVQKPSTITVKSGSTTLTSGTHYTLSYSNSNSTNVGTYSITANPTNNYSFTAVSANYTINKINPTIVAPTAKANLVYSGSALTLYNAGTNTTAGSFAYTNGSRTEAGSQTVSWSFTPTDTANYNSKSGSFTGTINKATLNAPTATGATTTYNTTATATASGGGGLGSIEWSNGNTLTSVGSKKTKARWSGNSNYYASNWSNEVTITMNKANPTITATPTDRNSNYTGSALNLLLGGTANIEGSFSYSTGTNAGTYTATWTFTPTNTTNYNVISGTVTAHIKKIDPTITAPTVKSNLIYSGASLTLYNAGSNTTAGSFSYTNGTRTDAGNLTVTWTFTPTDTTNYNTKTGTLNGVIAARPINVTAGSNSKTYDKSALTYNSATAEATGTNRGLVSGHSMTSCTVTGTITNVGTANNVPSSAVIKSGSTDVTSNYSITYINGTLTVIVRTVTLTWGTITWTYDKTAHSTTCTAGNLCSGDTCTVTLTGNSITNKGTTTVTASSLSNSNYALPSSKTNTLTVNARTVTLTWGTVTWTYDRTAHGTTCTAGNVCSGDTCIVTLTGNSITNKGTTTVTASSLSNSNYALPSSKTKTLTINARTVTLSWGTLTWTYDGKTHSTTCTAGNVCSGDSCTVTLTGNSVGANVGTATVTASSLSNSNYALPSSKTATLTINKATGSASVSGVSLTFNNSSRSLVTVSGNTGTMHYRVGTSGSWTTTIPTSTNVGSWTIYYYMDASTNYTARGSSSSPWGSVSSSIGKAAGSVSTAPTAKNPSYTGSAQALVNAGSGTGTMYYRLGTSGSFSTAIPTATDMGSYTVQYYAAASTNYNQSATGSVSASIAMAEGFYPPSLSLSYSLTQSNWQHMGSYAFDVDKNKLVYYWQVHGTDSKIPLNIYFNSGISFSFVSGTKLFGNNMIRLEYTAGSLVRGTEYANYFYEYKNSNNGSRVYFTVAFPHGSSVSKGTGVYSCTVPLRHDSSHVAKSLTLYLTLTAT